MLKDILKEKLEKRKRKWWDWHKQNPQVWDKFEEYTLEAINSGRKKYSHWAIINQQCNTIRMPLFAINCCCFQSTLVCEYKLTNPAGAGSHWIGI